MTVTKSSMKSGNRKEEARSTAGAQGLSPARRAREKEEHWKGKVPEGEIKVGKRR